MSIEKPVSRCLWLYIPSSRTAQYAAIASCTANAANLQKTAGTFEDAK
jgi:hypothetical protein